MTRLLFAQNNTRIGDFEGNTNALLHSIKIAKSKNASLVVSSELALCGYPPNDFLNLPHFLTQCEGALEKIRKASAGLTVIVGCPSKNEQEGAPLHNSAYVFQDQKLLAKYDKCLLPTYDIFNERRFFEPGRQTLIFEHEGYKMGVTICEDIWEEKMHPLYLFNPLEYLVEDQPDFLINLSSSPFELDKMEQRLEVGKKAAKKLNCPLIYCNQVGGNDDLIFDGHSFICDDKQLLYQAKGFCEDQALVHLKKLSPKKRVRVESEEQLYHALVLGLRDFFHKQGFKQAVLGLSGGIDSALVATLAVEALGKKNVLALSMPSRYSSKGSVEDAKQLAKNLGISLTKVPIETLHNTSLELLTAGFKGSVEGITEENIQARIRGLILMAFSNQKNRLVLCCSNKSEAAMGYATLYGDLIGGLSVISDLTKTQVYALSKWIQNKKKVFPKSILTKAPSAELKPNQKDSDSLPDYAILDAVISAYMEDRLEPQQIAKKLKLKLPFILSILEKIHQAEYKRRQSPLGLRVSSKAFSVGWKYPIVHKFNS